MHFGLKIFEEIGANGWEKKKTIKSKWQREGINVSLNSGETFGRLKLTE